MARSGLIFDDRYRLEERIAAGSFGQVWRASDLLLERPVAVKLLRPEYAGHPETLERFRKEARHAGALSHPGIAQVHDYSEGGSGSAAPPYLVMEFVDGPSLADLLAARPLGPALALDVIAQAAAGLDAAHRIGLVHRDVKPGNILLGPEGRVKVTDFGIAHAAGQAPVTDPGLVMGTTMYLAPERITGAPGTPASDLYALGIVLHECLTGVSPYKGTPSEVLAAHLHLPLPSLPDGLPAELADFVARLTAKDPGQRLADAREVAAQAARLRDALPGEPASRSGDQPTSPPAKAGATDGRPARGGRVLGRRRAAAFAAGTTLLAGASLAALLAAGLPGGRPASEDGPGSPASAPGSVILGRLPSSGTPGPAGPAGTGPGASASGQPDGHRKARHRGRPTPSGSASPGASTSPTPSGTPSGTPGGTPTPSPSGTGGGSSPPPLPLPTITIKL